MRLAMAFSFPDEQWPAAPFWLLLDREDGQEMMSWLMIFVEEDSPSFIENLNHHNLNQNEHLYSESLN